jgi:hypothetical protein
MDATYRRASTEIDGKNKFDAGSMRVDEHGSITGTCVGSKETDRYLVRVRVSRSETQGDPPTGASAFEGSWIEATCDCPAATKPPFVQHKTTPGKKPSPAAPKGSCKHSCALLLWRARTLALPGDASPAADDDTDPVATQPAAPAAGAPAAVATAPPPRPAGAGGKKRRLPQSLVRAAAAAEAAAEERTAKTAKKGTAKTAKGTPGGESGSTRKPRRADASEASGRAARVKLEPGGGGAGSAGTREPEAVEVPNPHADIIAKVKAVTDEQLLAACERIMAAEREEAAAAVARAAAPVRSAPADPAPPAASAPAAPAPTAASRPAASQAKKVDLLDDLFDFAPVPTARGGRERQADTRSCSGSDGGGDDDGCERRGWRCDRCERCERIVFAEVGVRARERRVGRVGAAEDQPRRAAGQVRHGLGLARVDAGRLTWDGSGRYLELCYVSN